MDIDQDSARIRVPPPLIYLSALLVGVVAELFLGQRGFGLPQVPRLMTGAALVLAGIALLIAAATRFQAAGTDVKPWKTSSAIVSAGVYRWTRNPMYLGMGSILAGLALVTDSPVALFLLVPVLVIIQTQVIAREERYLETKFGDAYLSYKHRVRRWL